jgi:hypothetical protein
MTHDTKDRLEQGQREDTRLSTADVAETMSRKADRSNEQQVPDRTPLLPENALAEFRTRWDEIQTSFVDEPRRSVEEADSLVAELMHNLARSFADERQNLEAQWGRGDDVSTEDLRVTLQRYRFFFSRLLSV